MNTLLAAGSAVVIAILIIRYFGTSRHPSRLPPGPKGWPIIGNLLDFPRQKAWLTFARWGETYGDISSVTIFGQTFIVLNSRQVASEILDKKSAVYSDRPVLPVAGEMVGWKNALHFIPYGNAFRQYRKAFHQVFGTTAALTKTEPLQESSTRQFVRQLTKSPSDFLTHIRTHLATLSLDVTYGYETKDANDPMVLQMDHVMKDFATITAPGGFLVDVLPFLRHIPSWLPGGGFHQVAKEKNSDLLKMGVLPYQHARGQFDAGTIKDCFVSATLPSVSSEDEGVVIWTAGSLAAGGFTTRNAMLKAFFLSMAQNPQVQKKAQAEIDTIIGKDRLPEFADRSSLPYINALCKEVFRFHSVVPTCLPHVAMEDGSYGGYFIPKGAIIFANIWNMHHNPRFNPQADVFMPERFMGKKDDEKDVYDLSFGFGRRVCPGRLVAEDTMFIVAATALATLDISKAVDERGAVVEPVLEAMNGSVSQPTPFKCSIKPRSTEALALIEALDQ